MEDRGDIDGEMLQAVNQRFYARSSTLHRPRNDRRVRGKQNTDGIMLMIVVGH